MLGCYLCWQGPDGHVLPGGGEQWGAWGRIPQEQTSTDLRRGGQGPYPQGEIISPGSKYDHKGKY